MEDYKKKYEDVVKELKKFFINNDDRILYKHDIERVFPELKESEDERIRKELINFFSKGAEYDSSTNGIKDRNIIAWLEKQGEQKTTNKIQPRFKVGDTIRYKNSGAVFTIKSVFSDHYSLTNNEGLLYFIFQDEYALVEQKPIWSEEDEDMVEGFK